MIINYYSYLKMFSRLISSKFLNTPKTIFKKPSLSINNLNKRTFFTTNSKPFHDNMLYYFKNYGTIKSNIVYNTMNSIDRLHFCNILLKTRENVESVYKNRPHAIGFNTTVSAPNIQAFVLEELCKAHPTIQNCTDILDIGSGSGLFTAYLSKITNPKTNVVAVDHIEKLTEVAKKNCINAGVNIENISFVHADWLNCVPEFKNKLFDVIHLGGSVPSIPNFLLTKLKVGGVLLGPAGLDYDSQAYYKVVRVSDDEYDKQVISDSIVFAPLTTFSYQLSKDYGFAPFDKSGEIFKRISEVELYAQ